MKANKIISIVLSIVLVLSFVTSCSKDKSLDEVVTAADDARANDSYLIKVKVDYSAEDKDINGIFEQLERMDITLFFKNGNVKAVNDMSIDYGEGDTRFVTTYTAVDGVLYLDMSYSFGNVFNAIKNKASLKDGTVDQLISETSFVGGIKVSDFASTSMEKQDGEYVITCTDVSTEQIVALEKTLSAQLEGTAETVKATDVKMIANVDDGKYDGITVYCTYEMTMGGTVYPVSMAVELDFDYDSYVEITAPANTDEYSTVNVEDILG